MNFNTTICLLPFNGYNKTEGFFLFYNYIDKTFDFDLLYFFIPLFIFTIIFFDVRFDYINFAAWLIDLPIFYLWFLPINIWIFSKNDFNYNFLNTSSLLFYVIIIIISFIEIIVKTTFILKIYLSEKSKNEDTFWKNYIIESNPKNLILNVILNIDIEIIEKEQKRYYLFKDKKSFEYFCLGVILFLQIGMLTFFILFVLQLNSYYLIMTKDNFLLYILLLEFFIYEIGCLYVENLIIVAILKIFTIIEILKIPICKEYNYIGFLNTEILIILFLLSIYYFFKNIERNLMSLYKEFYINKITINKTRRNKTIVFLCLFIKIVFEFIIFIAIHIYYFLILCKKENFEYFNMKTINEHFEEIYIKKKF